ncbi:MAG: hypothetical protein AMS21_09565 [Gemmatimonas sp. SG8_38_2]|nr:MAG: hypothetical protein AMS21_09565 [Gemmatimonas sp. SG8_38_2]
MVPDGAEPGALDHFLAVLFHGFNLWRAGFPVYAFETEVIRYLLDTPPALADWKPVVPVSCFYAEMPRNLFWTAVSEGQPPEPLEGFFVDSSRGVSSPEIDVLMILGMRTERPGFGVVGTTIDLQQIRGVDEPDAFTSEIPGADLAGLYSMQRTSEIGILLERLLWYLDVHTESLERVEADDSRQRESAHGTSTGLGFYRVSLTAERNRE